MEKIIKFLKELNELTNRTGIVIETFGDSHYNPSLCNEGAGEHNGEGEVYFSYDSVNKTYVGRLGNPYCGKIIFPKDNVEE